MKTKLLKHLAFLAVTIAVYKDGVTLSSMTLPGSSFWGIEMQTLVCEDTGSVAGVDCGTPTVKVPALSSGPFTLWVGPGTIDCYRYLRVNSNGSVVPDLTAGPNGYTKCPQ